MNFLTIDPHCEESTVVKASDVFDRYGAVCVDLAWAFMVGSPDDRFASEE